MQTAKALSFTILIAGTASVWAQKPAITLDEFLNTTAIRSARIAPDGQSAVVATTAPDWEHERFRQDIWLWREASNQVLPLTRSGHDSAPEWSPDGKWIAFLSDRLLPEEPNSSEPTERIWILAASGGEAIALYREKLAAHAFAWASDSSAVYLSVTDPLSKEQEEEQKKAWKDVIRWREQEHGDALLRIPVVTDVEKSPSPSAVNQKAADDKNALPKNAKVIAKSTLEIDSIVPSHRGERIAFLTEPISHRLESPGDYEVFLVSSAGGAVQQATHNEAIEGNLQWSADDRNLYFAVHAAGGSLEGKYRDVQGRLYCLDLATQKVESLGGEFQGSWEDFVVTQDGTLLATGLTGLEQQVYRISGAHAAKLSGRAGTYGGLHLARQGSRFLLIYSAISEPNQIYLADDAEHLAQAKPITDFNPIFKERAAPEWKPYQWKADDGRTLEGVLLYPPAQFAGKKLRMLTLIHGGPADADGNRFGANWYDWASLAAAKGWLVFRPNYRGSSGYGDDFMSQIAPHLVSRPGKDILEGVDALVKDGIADPERLAIGGYSYGGYMTNWLITQTTRFKAAVTGAGAIEHAANWGNDDLTFDDAWYLSGTPWQHPELYQSEGALFQFDKVRTPTHLVHGNADVRVSYLEGVLMERALEKLNIPHSFLVFPGEGHPLAKNPWHGYIKVKEELNWLEKYAGGQ